jgi:hypothetical protein
MRKSSVSRVVFVVTAWNERTNYDTVLVFADKDRAEKAWARLSGEDPERVYGGVVRRIVKL